MCIAGPQLWCPSSWKLYLDDFPFFGFLSSSSGTQVTTVWSWWPWRCWQWWCVAPSSPKPQTVVTWVLDDLERNPKISDLLLPLRNFSPTKVADSQRVIWTTIEIHAMLLTENIQKKSYETHDKAEGRSYLIISWCYHSKKIAEN